MARYHTTASGDIPFTPEEEAKADIEEQLSAANMQSEIAIKSEFNNDLSSILPSWAEVKTSIENITTIGGLKLALIKIARIVYWLAKRSRD